MTVFTRRRHPVALACLVVVLAGCTKTSDRVAYAVTVNCEAPHGIDGRNYDFEIITTARSGSRPVPGVVVVQQLDFEFSFYRGDELLSTLHSKRDEAGESDGDGSCFDLQKSKSFQVDAEATRFVTKARGKLYRSPSLVSADLKTLSDSGRPLWLDGVFYMKNSFVAGTGGHAGFAARLLEQYPATAHDFELGGRFEDAFRGAEPIMSFEFVSIRERDGGHHFELSFSGPASVPTPLVIDVPGASPQ